MMRQFGSIALPVLALSALLPAVAGNARADINGFATLASQWEQNYSDSGSTIELVTGGILLTTGAGQHRGVMYKHRQDISYFEARYTYRTSSVSGDGQTLALVIHTDTDGVDALGNTWGYSGISPSRAVVLVVGPSSSSVGTYANGATGSGLTSTAPVNASTGHLIDVEVIYDGANMTVNMRDRTTGDEFPTKIYPIGSLPDALGAATAYVGFNATTDSCCGGIGTQYITDFTFIDGSTITCGDNGNADLNGDGVVDILDFLSFMEALSNGC